MRVLILALLVAGCSTFKAQNPALSKGTDFHMHIHSPWDDDDMQFTGTRAQLAADSIGLKRALLLSLSYQVKATEAFAIQENNFVAGEVKKDPAHLAGACSVNPRFDWATKELRRCKDLGFKVVKVHFMASGMDLKNEKDFEAARKYLGIISELGMAVIVHASYPVARRGNEGEKLVSLINEFSGIPWIIGHLFGKEFPLLQQIKHDNFHVEISVVPIFLKAAEEKAALVQTMRRIGIKKFVFGSDWPVFHPAEVHKGLVNLGLSPEEVEQIMFTNAEAFDYLFPQA